MPCSRTACCSCGAKRRGVNPAAARSRQKSLRGLAKWAPAAADTKPGLIPQKTTRSRGARTSGTALSVTASISLIVRLRGFVRAPVWPLVEEAAHAREETGACRVGDPDRYPPKGVDMPKVVITHAVQDIDRWLQGKEERAAAIESAT